MGPRGEDPHRVVLADPDNEISSVVWSPDRRALAYLSRQSQGEKLIACRLRSHSIDTNQDETLLSEPRLCNGWGRVLWLPANRIIMSLSEPSTESDSLWELWLDGSGKPRGKVQKIARFPLSEGSLNALSASADGKRLAFVRFSSQDDVYIGQLESGGKVLKAPHRLTFDESGNGPTDWSPDGKYVYFMSGRNRGRAGIYRQKVDAENAEPIITGPTDDLIPRFSSDDKWILYVESRPGHKWTGMGAPEPIKILRIPASGGPPQMVLMAERYAYHDCTRAPANLCILGEASADHKRLILTRFDPIKGRGPE